MGGVGAGWGGEGWGLHQRQEGLPTARESSKPSVQPRQSFSLLQTDKLGKIPYTLPPTTTITPHTCKRKTFDPHCLS